MTTQLGRCTQCEQWGPVAFRNRYDLVLCPECLEKWCRRIPPVQGFPRKVSFSTGASVTLTGDVREGSEVTVRGRAYRVSIPPECREHAEMLKQRRQM